MSVRATLRIGQNDEVRAAHSDGVFWVYLGDTPVFCPDPKTAERIAAAFDELAEKMREAKRAEDGPSFGEATDPHSGDMATYHLTASGAAARLATHDPDDRR